MIDFLDILLIIVVAVSTGLLGGLIYLLYLPFKRRLQKSGRLSEERNRKINRSFIISICLIFCSILVVVYSFGNDGRTQSKDRLEKIANVKLPSNFKVLKYEYHDMMMDYCILFDIQFDNNSSKEFIKSIKTSKFYNKNSFSKGRWEENDFIVVDSVKSVWCKSPKGYDFSGVVNKGYPSYTIEFDTVTNILQYEELH